MSTMKQDLRYAVRMLRKDPGFTILAVLTLTLGIGANTAMFSVVNAALLHPLPFPRSQELVQMGRTVGHTVARWQSLPDFREAATQMGNTVEMGAMSPADSYTWIGHGEPRQLAGVQVTSNLFHVLGVQPILGRGFTTEDAQVGHNVVLLDGNLWKRQMDADRAVIGSSMTLAGQSYTVIGAMPSHFLLNPEAKVYLPKTFNQLLLGGFAGLALLLAAIGIYGVMAYAVVQRMQEIGVRRAMGVRPRDVLRLVIRQGMSVAGAGVAAGIVLALLLTRLLASLLFGISPPEPLVYAGLAVVLALVTLAANLIPALRAARVDPMIVQRSG